MRTFLLPVALALPLAAAYSYFLNADFQAGTPSGTWQSNGAISGTAPDGLASAVTNGGSVIYKNAISDPQGTDLVYELSAKLKISVSGGTFVLYSRATQDALSGPGAQGSFYAAEFSPTVSGAGCTMAASYYKRVSGVVYLMATQTLACANNMTIRWAQKNGYASIITSLNELYIVYDASVGAGRPGFGARSMPGGNGILEGKIGNREYVAPGMIDATSVRSALFDKRVDLAWTGVVDDTNGSGFLMYYVLRNGVFFGNVRGAFLSDSTVNPNTTYTYTLYPHDVHLNYSSLPVTVTTPPLDHKDPRKVGVRPLGTYWGASPENIDLQSGNLSFSLPTVTAQGRGGTAVPFRLSYNSQNWRKDPTKAWLLGTDVGFGFGWKMLAGSLTPIYSDWFTINHYLYTDSTGAEYDLDVNAGGIWRSKTGIFVEYDATKKRLYFPGGTFWEFDCTASGTEADAGTLYPTRLVDTNGDAIS